MTKHILNLIILFALLFHSPFIKEVSAHILKTDNDIGVVFHATPEDDPIINQTSNLYFDITDKTKKFKPENCNCTLSITKGEQEYLEQALYGHNAQLNNSAHNTTFTFKEKGIYLISVSGTPIDGNGFQPFKITFNQRVERTSELITDTKSTQNNPLLYILPALIVLATIIIFAKKPKSKNSTSLKTFLLIIGLTFTVLLLNSHHLLLHSTHHNHQSAIQISDPQPLLPCCIPQTPIGQNYLAVLPTTATTSFPTEDFTSQMPHITRASQSRAPPASLSS